MTTTESEQWEAVGGTFTVQRYPARTKAGIFPVFFFFEAQRSASISTVELVAASKHNAQPKKAKTAS
jgi:hypothetical protein